MTIEVRVPNLPESVADATLVKWHKKAGEAVSRDENLADLETDKVVLEVPATAGGVLKEILVAEGTVVVAGQVLALLEEGAVVAAPAAAAPAVAAAAPASAAKVAPSATLQRIHNAAPKLLGSLIHHHGLIPLWTVKAPSPC